MGGKFLRKCDSSGLWFEIGDDAAREKTSQALRQRAPEMRRILFGDSDESATTTTGRSPPSVLDDNSNTTMTNHHHHSLEETFLQQQRIALLKSGGASSAGAGRTNSAAGIRQEGRSTMIPNHTTSLDVASIMIARQSGLSSSSPAVTAALNAAAAMNSSQNSSTAAAAISNLMNIGNHPTFFNTNVDFSQQIMLPPAPSGAPTSSTFFKQNTASNDNSRFGPGSGQGNFNNNNNNNSGGSGGH
jgi:hypothetical protein